jgi:hypothetical protein
MLVYTRVTEWRIDSGVRVRDHTSGDKYLLNHRNMFELHACYTGGTWMYYFDNRNDSRCGGAYLRSVNSVALLKARADYTPDHEGAVVLPAFPNNDLNETPVSIYVPMDQISRAWPYDKSDSSAAYTWVTYSEDGWDMKTQLCMGSFDALCAYVNAIDP